MFEYKTWKYRLMPAYFRRKVGAKMLAGARGYLWRSYWNEGWPLYGEPGSSDYAAANLIWDISHKHKNFYVDGNYYPIWMGKAEHGIWLFKYRLRVIWKALYFSDEIGFVD